MLYTLRPQSSLESLQVDIFDDPCDLFDSPQRWQRNLQRYAVLCAREQEREMLQLATQRAIAYEQERRRQESLLLRHRATMQQAIDEEEEVDRERQRRAWTYRQEMTKKARQAELERAQTRELHRLRHRRHDQQEWTGDGSQELDEHGTIDLVESLIESFLASQPSKQSRGSTSDIRKDESSSTSINRHDSNSRQSLSHESTPDDPPVLPSSGSRKPESTMVANVHTPTPCSPSEVSSEDGEKHFERHLTRCRALEQLSKLSSTLSERQTAFVPPTSFHFQSSPDPPFRLPRLAFGSANSSFLAYEDFLVALLSEIDAVESGGDHQVKKSRKELVRRVEAQLSRLDEMKERAWERQQGQSESDRALTPATTSSNLASDSAERDFTLSVPPRIAEDDQDSSLPDLDFPPLTEQALSSVPPVSDSLRASSSSPSASGSESSATSSTLTVSSASSHSSEVDLYITKMLERARHLSRQAEGKLDSVQARPLPPPPTVPLLSVAVA